MRAAVGAVADPELPVVTLAMLGMVHAVEVDAAHASVELLPTFAGCPATEMIGADARAAALAVDGVETVTVRFRFSPVWTPARISPVGHQRLREFGIAPPTGTGTVSDVGPAGRRSLPVVSDPKRTRPELRPGGGSEQPTNQAVGCDGGRTRPELRPGGGSEQPTNQAVGCDGGRARTRPCPYCGSAQTVRESAFGPTPCRDIRYCATCQQPFEAFKQ